ncbi:hypothetical protein CERZMDRAFT_35207 [Cercospora zeae-maydis SCOH1-5]|uniref:Serine aminopeptidase S33 domain-containing protein n=1 Tax=Cercospora zeae-maydis SCOH1-5 TaxID=717836 RepID=A0A6A6FR95_9PEZI|nr:hypothetical protein CERZMDRAFT_35207 [Cercospora zeae-maydis SCOH1-5]
MRALHAWRRSRRLHSCLSSPSGRSCSNHASLHLARLRPSVAHEPAPTKAAYKAHLSKRAFWSGLPSILVPPAVFASLLVGLWTYKCMMTVLFQDKIIYMPYMPPYARKERVQDYAAVCDPVEWEHVHIKSTDGTKIALCVGKIGSESSENRRKKVGICYFQGNGSSTPPRLPLLSNTLKAIQAHAVTDISFPDMEFVLVALSYRGYWTSGGRASQKGIEEDAKAMLKWVEATQNNADTNLDIFLWGQSIGAGVAATAASSYASVPNTTTGAKISGLILETPFTGIKSMLLALYPQKWLPYRYLWPFLWNHWDSQAALQALGRVNHRPTVLIMPATRDEVVPSSEADKLERIARNAGLRTLRTNIIGALHTEATTRKEGQTAIAKFVCDVLKEAHPR